MGKVFITFTQLKVSTAAHVQQLCTEWMEKWHWIREGTRRPPEDGRCAVNHPFKRKNSQVYRGIASSDLYGQACPHHRFWFSEFLLWNITLQGKIKSLRGPWMQQAHRTGSAVRVAAPLGAPGPSAEVPGALRRLSIARGKETALRHVWQVHSEDSYPKTPVWEWSLVLAWHCLFGYINLDINYAYK